jgi:TPR repeat protein
MYDHGLGVKTDHETAVRWFRRAADAGNSAGEWDLGWAYAYGKGVGKDMAKALVLIRSAAAHGEVGARKWLAEHGPVATDKKNEKDALLRYGDPPAGGKPASKAPPK